MLFINRSAEARKKQLSSQRLSSFRGYTMSEIIIVIVVLGLLTAIAVPIYNNVRNAGSDNVKIKNADLLNQLATTIHNGGVNMTGWVDSTSAIGFLHSGVSIPSMNPNAAGQQVKLENTINPAAYNFTAGDASTAPHFDPIFGHPEIAP